MCKNYVRKFAPSNCTNCHCHIQAVSQTRMQAANRKSSGKKADRYGAWFLTLFRPETRLYRKNQKHPYKYNWEEFVRFETELRQGRFIDNM